MPGLFRTQGGFRDGGAVTAAPRKIVNPVGDRADAPRLRVASLVSSVRLHPIWSDRWDLPEDLPAERPLIAISAPAGYGKSTMLAHWQKQLTTENRRVISLVVDPDDRDGDHLMLDLLNAFSPGDIRRSQMLSTGVGDHGRRAMMMALLAEMASHERPAALFIDDVHWLNEAASKATLQILVEHQPRDLLLVLASRVSGAMQISNALLDCRARIYSGADLAFAQPEVIDLLLQHGIKPRPALVETIVRRTEGWPAAVRLIAMTMGNDEREQDRFFDALTERPQPLTDYLGDLLLTQLPENVSEFLLGVAILRRFSVPLAIATTHNADAARMLDDLERRALPLSATGDRQLPYSIHPLVREFLIARLKRDEAALLEQFAERARTWLAERDMIGEAIDLCLDIGDVPGAVTLIDRFALTSARHLGQHSTYLYWCNKLPREQLSRFPRVQIIRMWALGALRCWSEADQILAQLEEDEPEDGWGDGSGPGCIAETLDVDKCIQVVLRDKWIESVPLVQRLQRKWPDGDKLNTSMVSLMAGVGEIAQSRFDTALEHLRAGCRGSIQCNAPYVAAWGIMWTVSVLAKQGNYRQGLYEVDEGIAHVSFHLGAQTSGEIMLQAERSFLLYEFNRLDEAAAALERGLTAVIDQNSVDSLIMGYVALARLQNARGEHLDSAETLAEGEIIGWSHELPRLAIALGAERINILLHQGEYEQAAGLWDEMKRTVKERAPAGYERVMLDKASRIEARLALAKGNPGVAAERLRASLDRAVRTGQKRKQVELLLLQAIATHQLGREDMVTPILRRAVDIAMPQGFVRVFVDEGAAILPLLTRCLEPGGLADGRPAIREYLGGILQSMNTLDVAAPPPSANIFMSELTQTEFRIAGLLDSTLTNRQLANVLLITEGTLKWHLKNIYSKLGVSSRLSAIARLRNPNTAMDEEYE